MDGNSKSEVAQTDRMLAQHSVLRQRSIVLAVSAPAAAGHFFRPAALGYGPTILYLEVAGRLLQVVASFRTANSLFGRAPRSPDQLLTMAAERKPRPQSP